MMENLVPKIVKDGKIFSLGGQWFNEGDVVMVSPSNKSANLRDMTITEYNIKDIEVTAHIANSTTNPRLNLENELKLAIVDDLIKNGGLTQKEIAKIDKYFFKSDTVVDDEI